MSIAIYPGSFDPITLGHVDIISRASRLYDCIVVAVAKNFSKNPFISTDTRLLLVKDCVSHLPNVKVKQFEGLTVDFAKANGASVIIRGLRAISDFEYEFKMSQMNKTLSQEIETIFMMSSLDYQFISSSLAREVAALGGDVSTLVPRQVHQYLKSL